MFKPSAYLTQDAEEHLAGERGYYIAYGSVLFAAGVTMLILPAIPYRGVVVVLAGWLLFLSAILSLLRPLSYSRGAADVSMGLITAVYYAVVSWASSGADYSYIWRFHLAVCVILFFTGFSRMLVFARLVPLVGLPLLLLCGVADVTAAVMLFLSVPDNRVQTVYWFLGMLLVLNGLETVSEAYFLKAYAQKRRLQRQVMDQ